MNVRNLLTVHTILVALVALTAMLAPTLMLETAGLEVSQTSNNVMREFGAVIVGFGIASWLLRGEPASRTRKIYLLGVGASFSMLAVMNIINILGWSGTLPFPAYAILTLNIVMAGAFFYFGYKEPLH